MAEFKIEKGVPIPAPPLSGRRIKYPWREMEIGDSFFVPGERPATKRGLVSSANKHYAPKRFVSRTVDGGVRVWRIA